MIDRRQVHASLPDLGRWIETRGMIADEDCPIFADDWRQGFVVVDEELASIVGRPGVERIREALGPEVEEVLVFEENLDLAELALTDWFFDHVLLHRLPPGFRLPPPRHECRNLARHELDAMVHLSDELRAELVDAMERPRELSAVFMDGVAVAFCYATYFSETIWDVSIDTIPSHRRQGCAQSAFLHRAHEMGKDGMQPIWCSASTNPASWNLAHKIGFEQEDTFWIATREEPDH